MKAMILAGVLVLSSVRLTAQTPPPGSEVPTYRGFYPGMTQAQLRDVARSLTLTVECAPIMARGVGGLCQTTNALAVVDGNAQANHTEMLAGFDSLEGIVRYVVVLEPPARLPALLRERTDEWGKPYERSGELIQWDRVGYGMAVSITNLQPAVIIGVSQGPGPGLKVGLGMVDDPPQLIGGCGPIQSPSGSGKAVLQFIVGVDGAPESASFKVMSANQVVFGDAAIGFLQSCRFKPGRVEGQVVRVLVQQTVNFSQGSRP